MKLYAQVKLKDAKDAQEMVRAFFEKFDPESSIHIKGQEAKLIFIFQDSPKEMAEVLSKCEIFELSYGNGELLEGLPSREITSEDKEKLIKHRPVKEKKKVNVQELDEIAKGSSSYEDFISEVGHWLDMQSLQNTFEGIVRASFCMEHLSWNAIEELLHERGYTFDKKTKLNIHKKVIAKLGKYFNRTVSVLQALKEYENYPFTQKEADEQTSEGRLTMECMPYIEEFDKALQDTSLIDSCEEKLNYILSAMGIDNEEPDKKTLIISVARVAFNQEVDLNQLVDALNIFKEQKEENYMIFSTFLNSYLKKNGINKPVKAVDFLVDLRKLLMVDKEKL